MRRCVLVVRCLAAVLLCSGAVATADASVKGRAYAVYANLPSHGIGNTTHCDSGWLNPLSGGNRSSYKSNVAYGDVLHCDYMYSESHGDHCKGHSSSTLEAGWIMRGQPFEVTWTHMQSVDEDTCCRAQDRDDIASVFIGLTFAGRPVRVTGVPNQTLTVPGLATLILNEVKHDAEADDHDCDDDDTEHHALHLVLNNGNEVILGYSKFDSDDDCCRVTPTSVSTWGAVKAHYR